ncbi:MAG: hypothetical protein WDM84_08230 [Bauldia sp.]
MTDFYALLKQSILDRGIRNVGERQEIYAQARRAVIKQLWGLSPAACRRRDRPARGRV